MLVKQGVFGDWISMPILEADTLYAVMIWPLKPQEPQYRDVYPMKAARSISTHVVLTEYIA